VIDTSVFVSAFLDSRSIPREALHLGFEAGVVLISVDTLRELEDVLQRRKFNKFISLSARQAFLAAYADLFEPVWVTDQVTDCRDPKDNKFLELALSGKADFLITGDADLLSLHPWRGIAILSPADFLALSE
jgi:putative PIN family toxin of toxin-antitoxin system